MDKDKERNILTGTTMSKRDNTETNSLTGLPITKQAGSDGSDEAKWPSISKRSDNSEDTAAPEPQPEPVKKEQSDSQWPSFTGKLVGNDSESNSVEFEKAISMHVPILAFEKKGDEQIVYGIVYEPDTVDAQGDSASAEEIEKAANDFMENTQTFKIMHKGKAVNIKVLQSFVAPVDYTIAKRKVKKGSWVLVTRINDAKLWKDIKEGKYTGYSMAGYAKVD